MKKSIEAPVTIWGLLWAFKWYLLGLIVLAVLSPIFYGLKTIGVGVMSGGSMLLSYTKNNFATTSTQRT